MIKLAAVLAVVVADVRAERPPVASCDTVPTCIARARQVAHPDTGIRPSEDEVAKRLQGLAPESIMPVLELLDDSDKNVRELAGYILRDMPGLGPEHLGPLERAVEGGDGWLPPAIASIGTPSAIRFLVEQLRRQPETHTQLTYAFARLGAAALLELVDLFRCGTSCDERLLSAVGFILSEVREGATTVVEPLSRVAKDQTASLMARRSAIRALGDLRGTARPAVEALVEMTREEPVELRDEARKAVLRIGGAGTREVLESSLEAAAEDEHLVLYQIAALGERGHEAGSRVERSLRSGTPDVRVAAARALGLIGYRPSVPSLASALEDRDDWRLVYVAAEALGRLRATEARDALSLTAAGHWYPVVRDAARRALLALEAKAGATRPPTDGDLARQFLQYEQARHDYPPCADRAQLPAASSRSDKMDLNGQPSLAQQLAYDREIRSQDEKGWHTTRQRTIPRVGRRVEGGWLVGGDHGEWGGELVFKSDAGSTTTILDKNTSGLSVLGDERIVAVTGLAHMALDEGALYTIACTAAGTCNATRWKQLPGAPHSSWVTEAGELLVNTTGGSVLVAPDGTLRMVDCHVGDRPEKGPLTDVRQPRPR